MRIGKSRYVELDRTCCYTRKFNVAFSLYRVLEVALYFSKGFLEIAARGSAVAEALWPLRVTIVSELLKVDLIFIFPFFSFIFDLFSIFGTRVRVRVTRSRWYTAGHIR